MKTHRTILVTGGAGFIGSNFILDFFKFPALRDDFKIINLDKLTYAGNLANLELINHHPQYIFKQGDIGDRHLLKSILDEFNPSAIINFAAETHVDRSIKDAAPFIETNIVATHNLLLESLDFYQKLSVDLKRQFRFLHVSTDEVYGTLKETDSAFTELTPYRPNSPYAASKAASDHLVRAYSETYELPTLITNCSNNYGPYQFPEKLIPLCLINALQGRPLPIYGDGKQIRDWLFVGDHCSAIRSVLNQAKIGETYNVGGFNEKTNLEVVSALCEILDELKPKKNGQSYKTLMTFVKDRPGHDRRYAIDASKIAHDLGWRPEETFESGLRKTVEWYLENQTWIDRVQSGEYQHWIQKQYS